MLKNTNRVNHNAIFQQNNRDRFSGKSESYLIVHHSSTGPISDHLALPIRSSGSVFYMNWPIWHFNKDAGPRMDEWRIGIVMAQWIMQQSSSPILCLLSAFCNPHPPLKIVHVAISLCVPCWPRCKNHLVQQLLCLFKGRREWERDGEKRRDEGSEAALK